MVTFPSSPAVDATVVDAGRTWIYDGEKWMIAPSERGNKLPVGAVVSWTADPLPAQWLRCDGAAISRTTYALLYSVLQTRYGAGNGSTTFNLPDYRGRAFVGHDTTASGRLTTGICGFDPAVLGARGGNQYMHPHTHGVTDPGHKHSGWDNGHGHGQDAHDHSHHRPGHTHHIGHHQHGVAGGWHGHGVGDPGHSHIINISRSGHGPLGPLNMNGPANPSRGDNTSHNGSGVWWYGSGINSYADNGGGGVCDWRGVGTWSNGEYAWFHTGYVGVNIGGAASGIWCGTSGAGEGRNIQPCIVVDRIIFAGV